MEYSAYGYELEALSIFEQVGYDVVRLRLWHTPDEPWHGLDSTVAFAQRAVSAGFDLLLDLHYSDTWADPGHQTKPAAWEGLAFPVLVDSVYAYTNAVIRVFREAGALPRYVQIGNEITPGMLWNDGRVGGEWDTPQQWDNLCALLAAGIAGVRDSLQLRENVKIMLHVDAGGNNETCRRFFDQVIARGVQFDVIGLSFYPWWHGTFVDLEANLNDLATRYGKELWVVETAYPWTLGWDDNTNNIVGLPEHLLPGYAATPNGQAEFLLELCRIVRNVSDGLGRGICYWEPAWVAVDGFGCSWENLALFDFDHAAVQAMGVFVREQEIKVVLRREGDSVRLLWPEVITCGDAASEYRVWSAQDLGGPEELLGATADTTFEHSGVLSLSDRVFYRVEPGWIP